jgi:hypothetical protein
MASIVSVHLEDRRLIIEQKVPSIQQTWNASAGGLGVLQVLQVLDECFFGLVYWL